MPLMKKFYITTPIYYINAAPHIGHAYTTVAADALSRFLRSRGQPCHLLTGTDEHGAKIEQAAKDSGTTPQAYADRISEKFRELWRHLDVHYDDFIRTTEPRHEKRVQEVFATLLKSGDIYAGHYRGYYCIACETYWTKEQAAQPPKGKEGLFCPNQDCGRALQLVEEDSYFFRLSRYQERLLKHYAEHPEFLRPAHRGNEILSFVRSGLQDISVSRAKVKWGIPVPGDPGQTVYVWFDALLNYASACGEGATFQELWPADVHIVGKEIYRFHAVIWPAMLMALGLPLPSQVFAHGWWTVDGEKMSKSKGNFVDPYELTREFGVDAFRYFLLREIPFGHDGDFSREALRKRYNADLANDLGNLVSRVVEMVDKFLGGTLPKRPNPEKDFFPRSVAQKTKEIEARMNELDFSQALSLIWSVIGELNQRINEQAPWKVYKTDPEKVKVILFDLVWSLRIVAGWIEPFMPQTAAKIQAQLGVRQFPSPFTADKILAGETFSSGKITKGPVLFPRKQGT
ncbi:MAG: methionine--tRNA ligase [Elusimicrobia bacterium]|nr:methionine--tRNA ligase [Elusimicrobiota bacterium]